MICEEKCRLNCFRSIHLVRVVNQCPCCSSPDHRCFNCANYSVFSPCEWTPLDNKFKLVVTGTATSFGMNLLQSTRVSSNVSQTCSQSSSTSFLVLTYHVTMSNTHYPPMKPHPTYKCMQMEGVAHHVLGIGKGPKSPVDG